MPIQIKLAAGEAVLHGWFESPCLYFVQPDPQTCHDLIKALAPWEIQLSDLRYEAGVGSLMESKLSVLVKKLGALVEVRPDRLRLTAFELHQQDISVLATLSLGLLELTSLMRGSTYKSYSLEFNLHLALAETDVWKFLRAIVQVPSDLGPTAAVGATFFFPASESMLPWLVVLEPSASVEGALFLRCAASWDAKVIDIKALPEVVKSHVRRVFSGLGLATE